MNIGLYGDSTQAAVAVYGGVATIVDVTPASMLQMLLDRKYGAGVHTVNNYGVGGQTIATALATIAAHVTAHNDQIVVTNHGINDAYTVGNTAANHKNNYVAFRNYILGKGKQFVYESPNPITSVSHGSILTSFDAAVKTIPGIVVADVRASILSYYPEWAAHLSDGTHPNQILYLFIGWQLFNAIDPLL